jgi:hypothetical protein
MATPGELVEAIAVATGVPQPSVDQYNRQLHTAGLRTSGGRGRSAAKVTYLDAARLLIALMSTDAIKDAAAAVKVFGVLTCTEKTISEHRPKTFVSLSDEQVKQVAWAKPEQAIPLPLGHSFEEALAFVIEHAADPDYRNLIMPLSKDYGQDFRVQVDIKGCYARIQFETFTFFYMLNLTRKTEAGAAKWEEFSKNYDDLKDLFQRGLGVIRFINSERLLQISKLIAQD